MYMYEEISYFEMKPKERASLFELQHRNSIPSYLPVLRVEVSMGLQATTEAISNFRAY